MIDRDMSQAQVLERQTPFIDRAELWSGASDATKPSVGGFIGERLWNTLEATVITSPPESGRAPRAVLSIPWYEGDSRQACALLSHTAGQGTIEVWHVDPDHEELRLSSGYFGKWEDFRRLTALTRFTVGAGLPGRVWQSECPVLLEDLGESKAFLRADAAQSLGLQCGLGLPVRYASGLGVVVLLSSRSSPVGRSLDLWQLTESAEIDHLQGLTFDTSAREHACSLSVAQELAKEAASQFRPAVLSPDLASRKAPFLRFGFAWPSRTKHGTIHIATVVG